MGFEGRTALVTGGARGIGRAICLELARSGCDVALNFSRSRDKAEAVAREIASTGRRCEAFEADVSDFGAVVDMVRRVGDSFGRLDFLVNNAGIIRDGLILRMTEEEWDQVIDTNLKGAFHCSKAVVSGMIKARFGSILNITSISGLVGMAGQVNYSASKAGMIGLTKALAKEVASRNITVNALALGLIETDMTQGLAEAYVSRMKETIPLRRFGTPEEVGRMAVFLLSDSARYITGQVLQADGGLAM